jgi:chromosome segregation ATPase
MTDIPADEAQVRRALGLPVATSRPFTPGHSAATTIGSHQPKRRQFVRDGDVQVEIVNRHQSNAESSTNQLEAARNAMRSLTAAKDRAERLLTEAQATIHDLQTKLGHERLAKDEAAQRADADRKTIEQTLQSVRSDLAAQERSSQALRDAQASIANLTEKLHCTEQALQTVKSELASKAAQDAARNQVAGGDYGAAQRVRRPVGRPRKQVEKTLRTSKKATSAGEAKPKRTPKLPEKPVKWWVGKR